MTTTEREPLLLPTAGPQPSPLLAARLAAAIVITDRDGVVRELNDAAAALLAGRRPVGAPLAERWPFADPSALAQLARSATLHHEATVLGPAGLPLILRYSIGVLAAPAADGYVVSAIDISADRRRETALDAQRRAALAAAIDQDPAAVLGHIAREAAALAGADRAGVVAFEGAEVAEVATWRATTGDRGALTAPVRVPLPRAGAPGMVERDGQVHLIGWRATGRGLPWSPPVKGRTLALPVRVAGGLWGALWLTGEDLPDGPPAGGLVAMADLAALAAGRIEVRDYAVGEAMAAAFRGDTGAREALAVMTDSARRALGALRVTLHLEGSWDRSLPEDLVSAGADGAPRADVPEVAARLRDELPHWRLLLGRDRASVEIADLRSENRVATGLVALTDARTVILRRLESPGDSPRALGVLVACWEEPHRITGRDRMVVESLAGLAAVALGGDPIAAGPAAAVPTNRDPVTRLLNHRAFQERLGAAAASAATHGGELTLALIDIDRFRRVNELHGYMAGDRVLAEVARRLSVEAQEGDVLARVGGEEFAWLSHRSGVELLKAVDRARERIATGDLAGVSDITVSAGLSDLRQAGGRDDLERFAEGALYWAKQHGRDVALVYTPEVVEVLSADERAERLARSQALQSIRVLARAVDAKDSSTLRHSERVADLAVAIATALGWSGERLVSLREAGLVHDVGKIGVPDAILMKPARLTREEYREVMRHVPIGAEILTDVLSGDQVAWVRGHHERWDGGGYPDGVAGDEIPDGARILALADSWDVMTSERPYHTPLSIEAALAECARCRGAQFAPEAVDALAALVGAGVIPMPGL